MIRANACAYMYACVSWCVCVVVVVVCGRAVCCAVWCRVVCVYAQRPRNGIKEIWEARRTLLLPFEERPHGPQRVGSGWRPASGTLLWVQKEPACVPDSEAFNSFVGDGREAWEDEQADSSSENNVGNGALFVTGLHGSGEASCKTGRWQR